MSQKLEASPKSEIIYPESDGKPMAENTEQFTWIVVIKENLEILFADNADVFVAGDLLWYPVEGKNKLCQAPDALVVFGRPKGKRGSYKQWEEEDIPPQVVFEVLSPGNTLKEMAKKLQFYDRYGVEEYYLYDPERIDLNGWQRSDNKLTVIEEMNGWVSPRLGIRFEMTESGLEIYRPDGRRFLTPIELDRRAQEAEQQAQAAQQRIQQLEARLRELGIDPEPV
ncbi:Uma2 family endonuclease [Phormidium sp. CCY1219]|uniref:Uma2 family endonuclease n=1 Tax=Phormidium sp. CCY1219 TaxID=2886104 RepID=UPI002D1F77BA|nr:Uma2 family endonuclease [Phormidium sp. CCY1219]MEB3830660.1 Uma2 family endonuclease [Phormidium sp. CCY1219]